MCAQSSIGLTMKAEVSGLVTYLVLKTARIIEPLLSVLQILRIKTVTSTCRIQNARGGRGFDLCLHITCCQQHLGLFLLLIVLCCVALSRLLTLAGILTPCGTGEQHRL